MKMITTQLDEDVYVIDDVFCLDAPCNRSVSFPDYSDHRCCDCGAGASDPVFQTKTQVYCAKSVPAWKQLSLKEGETRGYLPDIDLPDYYRFYVDDPCKSYR